jgi:hypothetical protein
MAGADIVALTDVLERLPATMGVRSLAKACLELVDALG